ncbi:hypothetical protein G9P44_001806 [Scheffersomyces stipitis]|nr:hypothetical protein G9P44_001806 [Scheffersomyces stipitis]
MSSTTPTSIRLPSISELTSRSSPISEAPSQLSPRLRADSRVLPNLGGSTGSTYWHPLKATTPSNYVLGNTGTTNPNSLSKLPSPTLPYFDNKQGPSPLAAAPHHQLPTPPSHQASAPSSTSSPTSHYQYYLYHQLPVMHPGASPAPVQVAQSVTYATTAPGGSFYPQPVYYHQAPNSSVPMPMGHTQYAIPEVINKPTNKCHRCGTTETPEWRRGPKGVRTLCNACGLFHAKLVKRKGAALAAEEVLNNKVCKGKNGRRISIKKHLLNESMKNSAGPSLTKPDGFQHQSLRQLPTATALPLPTPISSHLQGSAAHCSHPNNYPTHALHLIRH